MGRKSDSDNEYLEHQLAVSLYIKAFENFRSMLCEYIE